MDNENISNSRQVSLGKAAKLVGISRPSIYRYASEGKLTTVMGLNGIKLVDLSELSRVFPEFKPETVENKTDTGKETVTRHIKKLSQDNENKGKNYLESAILTVELEAARKEADFYKNEVERLRERENKLIGIFKSHTLLLEHKPEKVKSNLLTTILLAMLLSVVGFAVIKGIYAVMKSGGW